MWHYVLPGAGADAARDGADSAAAHFVEAALYGARINRLAIREPYFFSAAQAESGLYDGDNVDLGQALRMILAAVVDDKSLPHVRLEGPDGQYAIVGLDGEIYLGLAARQNAAEEHAWELGCEVLVNDHPSPYLGLPGTALDPALDDVALRRIAARVDDGPLFALERWALGRYGELGHPLRSRNDVVRLSTTTRSRAGLAVFSAELVNQVDDIRTPLADPTSELARAELRLVYQRDGQAIVAVSFHNQRQLDKLLADVPAGSVPNVLVAPPFEEWIPPKVDAYVRPDSDGVIRSRLGYHLSEPD